MTARRASVVVTAHNEAAGIGRTLRDLARQTAPGVVVEVILVDDRSTDATVALARQVVDLPGLVVLSSQPDPALALTTRQQALDLGFGAASGEVILTLDADSRLRPGWLAAMTAPILTGRADAVAGPIGFHPPRGLIGGWQSCDAACYLAISALVARAGGKGGVFFGNFAFRSPLYRQVGGFAGLGQTLTEDLAFGFALQARGARLVYATGRARVDVAAVPGPGALVARLQRVTRGPFSALALALTLWPLSLLAAALWAPFGGGFLLALRYGAGLLLTGAALLRHGDLRAAPLALIHEPAVPLLALAVLARRLAGGRIAWGGRDYG